MSGEDGRVCLSMPPLSLRRPLAFIPNAVIGPGTRIGEYCVVETDVMIGARCLLEPYVYVKRWTTMGDCNEMSAGTALGTDPLDKAFTGERSYLVIGSRNKIREHYTISRGTKPESETRIGDGNYIMTSGHIAHNCVIGDNIVIASCALVAGYVGDGRSGVYFRRRGGSPVFKDRPAGNDRGQYAGESGRAALLSCVRVSTWRRKA